MKIHKVNNFTTDAGYILLAHFVKIIETFVVVFSERKFGEYFCKATKEKVKEEKQSRGRQDVHPDPGQRWMS